MLNVRNELPVINISSIVCKRGRNKLHSTEGLEQWGEKGKYHYLGLQEGEVVGGDGEALQLVLFLYPLANCCLHFNLWHSTAAFRNKRLLEIGNV